MEIGSEFELGLNEKELLALKAFEELEPLVRAVFDYRHNGFNFDEIALLPRFEGKDVKKLYRYGVQKIRFELASNNH